MKKMNPAAGMIRRMALEKYSLETLRQRQGMMNRNNKISAVQYQD
jgi:Tfp pilus assembly protein PilP